MNKKAIEAAAEVFRDAWRKPPEDGDDVTSLSRDFAYAALTAAKAALPPLRAREEIAEKIDAINRISVLECVARALLKHGPESARAFEALGVEIEKLPVAALSRTAGEEWRDIQTYTEVCMNEKCPRGGKSVTIIIPAPPVAGPIVADNGTKP